MVPQDRAYDKSSWQQRATTTKIGTGHGFPTLNHPPRARYRIDRIEEECFRDSFVVSVCGILNWTLPLSGNHNHAAAWITVKRRPVEDESVNHDI